MIGQTLSHFEITAKLGEGGMGEVYEARDTDLKRLVALKVLPPELAADPERLERFRREAEALAALSHPNIVTIYSVEQADDLHFLTMERVGGKSLDQRIPDGGFELDEFLDLATPLADALAAAHEKGITHRDLKPANIMVTDSGQLKVLDFGLAKLDFEAQLDEASQIATMAMTREGAILGTVPYMSPEQAQGQPVDPRSDVFSLGIVLYEMATGKHPFHGQTPIAIVSAILGQQPAAISEVKPGLPPQLEQTLGLCLAKDPDERFQSAAELREELQESRQHLPVGEPGQVEPTTSLPGARSRPGSRVTRPRTLVVLAAVALGLAALALLLPRLSLRRGPEPVPPFTLTQLTDLPGYEGQAALSPDGSQFLYVGDAAGNLDIYLRRVDGERSINLTEDYPGNDYHPAFSPDGQRIAFRSERAGGGLFVMGATGESPVRVVEGGFHPAWTPDGKALVYSTTETIVLQRGQGTGLWRVPLEGGAPEQLLQPDVAQPQLSPRGARVAFWSSRGGISTSPAWSEERISLPFEGYDEWGPAWSADGRYLYFVSNRGGQFNIWRVAIDEASGRILGAPQAVTSNSERVGRPSLSRDGRRLVYSTTTTTGEIFTVGFDAAAESMTSNPVPILRSTKHFLRAAVSPDGERIVYSSTEPQEDLYTIRSDGTGKLQLTDDDYLDRGATFSPDGSRIVFYSSRSSTVDNRRSSIWTISPDGGDLRLLLDDPAMTLGSPVWSPDGRVISVTGRKSDVWRLYLFDLAHLSEPNPVEHLQLVEEGENFSGSTWSPDGRLLAGYSNEGIIPLKVYDFDQATFRTVRDPSGSVLEAAAMVFLSDSRRLLYCHWRSGSLGIWDLATDEVRPIPGPGFGPRCKISLTADERTMVGSSILEEADVWLLEFGEGR